jgi:SAM-dependent methyltransferase
VVFGRDGWAAVAVKEASGAGPAIDVAIAEAYSATGSSWRDGPAVIYDRLAAVLVAHSPVSLAAAAVIDIGAGTGAATYAALAAGARSVVAVDAAAGMLAVDADSRPPAIVAEATNLPFAPASFDLALASFSFNHLSDPAAGFVEAARIVRPGGAVVASSYAADDQHPVKGAVDHSLRARGWKPDTWQTKLYRDRAPLLATTEACAEVIRRTGREATIDHVRVPYPELSPRQWVAWRLGLAQHAPFIDGLTIIEREEVVRDVLDELGDDAPPLVRSIMIIAMSC